MPAKDSSKIAERLYALVPEDGSTIGNVSLRHRLSDTMRSEISEAAYLTARDALVAAGKLLKGQGRGGSVRRAHNEPVAAPAAETGGEFALAMQAIPPELPFEGPRPEATPRARTGPKRRSAAGDPQVLAYRHADKRKNNPEVGMVTPESDPDEGRTRWRYDPHIDPALQFDVGRAEIERLIDDALASGDDATMREALTGLKRLRNPTSIGPGRRSARVSRSTRCRYTSTSGSTRRASSPPCARR